MSLYENRVPASGLPLAAAQIPDAFVLAVIDGIVSRIGVQSLHDLVRGTLPTDLAAKAPLTSPLFDGNPRGPTPAPGDNSFSFATTAFVKAFFDTVIGAAPGTLDTLDELAAALGDDPNFATTMATALGNRLRADAAQSFTSPQKVQLRANAGLVIGTDVAAQVGGANDDIMQRKSGAWVNRTIAQVLADLGIETGVWSPYLDGSGAGPSLSTAEQYGYYLAVRDFVFLIGGHAGTISSAGSGTARLLGLPFTPSPATTSTMSVVLSGAAFTGVPLATFAANGTAALGLQSTSGGTSSLAVTAFSGSFVCRIAGFYRK